MATIFLADEFLVLEIESESVQIGPFLDVDSLGIFDVEETGSRPREEHHWGYRVPCPGVRYYFYE
jgi:hypothetical protein